MHSSRAYALIFLVLPLAGLHLAASRQDVVPSKYDQEPGTFRSTNPKPPRLKAARADDLPGYYVPEGAETRNFTVVDSINGKKIATAIRVFAFDDAGHGKKTGEIPVGTVVTLKGMRFVDKTMFYAIPFAGKTVWINGYFLAPAK